MAPPPSVPVRPSAAVIRLSALVAVFALVAAGAGLFWRGGDGPAAITTQYGETVELYGKGIYRHDTPFKAGANLGADTVTLLLGIPLLGLSTLLYRRGSLRGALLLAGTLVWFLYTYASMALGTAYNNLFLLYIALFSASLFAFVQVLTSIDRRRLPLHISSAIPRRGIAVFMIASGLVTIVVWLVPLLGALVRNEPPALLDSYTVTVTDVLDLGVIAPAVFLAGALILRGDPLGYLIAVSLLVLEAMLAPMMVAQTLFQLDAGVSFTPGEIAGPLAGFGILALGAIRALTALVRNISQRAWPAPEPAP